MSNQLSCWFLIGITFTDPKFQSHNADYIYIYISDSGGLWCLQYVVFGAKFTSFIVIWSLFTDPSTTGVRSTQDFLCTQVTTTTRQLPTAHHRNILSGRSASGPVQLAYYGEIHLEEKSLLHLMSWRLSAQTVMWPNNLKVYICIKEPSCPRCNGKINQKCRWWGPGRSPQCNYSPIFQLWEPAAGEWQAEITGMDDHICIMAVALFDIMIDVACQDHVVPTWSEACRHCIYLCNQPVLQNCGAGRIVNSFLLFSHSHPLLELICRPRM